MTRLLQNVVPVGKRCPACDAGVTTQRDILPMKRPYLCTSHRELWDAADLREERESDRRYEREQARRENEPPPEVA